MENLLILLTVVVVVAATVISSKLNSIDRCLGRIETHLENVERENLDNIYSKLCDIESNTNS